MDKISEWKLLQLFIYKNLNSFWTASTYFSIPFGVQKAFTGTHLGLDLWSGFNVFSYNPK